MSIWSRAAGKSVLVVLWAIAGACAPLAAFAPAMIVAPAGAEARAALPACNGFEHKYFLGSAPVVVNPGGRCPRIRFRFQIALTNPSAQVPRICYFATVAGSTREYGPFCSGGANFRMAVPRPIETLRSSQPVAVYVKLCGARTDCR